MDLWSAIFTVVRRWYISLPIVLIAIVAMVAVGGKMKPDYETKASMVFNPPQAKIIDGQQKPFANPWAADPKTLAAAVYRQLNSTDEQKKLDDDGFSPRYTIALDQFTAIMDMTVTGKSEDQAIETANQLIKEAQRTAQAVQRNSPSRPPEDELVGVNPVSLPVDATVVPGSKTRVMATIILLGLVGAASAAFMVESLANRRRQAGAGGIPPLDPAYAGAYPPYPPYPSLPAGPYPTAPAPGLYAGYLPPMPGAPGPVQPPGNGPANGVAPEFAGNHATAPQVDELDTLLDEVTVEEQQAPARSTRPQSARVINRGRRSPRDAEGDGAAAEPVTGHGRRQSRDGDAAWSRATTDGDDGAVVGAGPAAQGGTARTDRGEALETLETLETLEAPRGGAKAERATPAADSTESAGDEPAATSEAETAPATTDTPGGSTEAGHEAGDEAGDEVGPAGDTGHAEAAAEAGSDAEAESGTPAGSEADSESATPAGSDAKAARTGARPDEPGAGSGTAEAGAHTGAERTTSSGSPAEPAGRDDTAAQADDDRAADDRRAARDGRRSDRNARSGVAVEADTGAAARSAVFYDQDRQIDDARRRTRAARGSGDPATSRSARTWSRGRDADAPDVSDADTSDTDASDIGTRAAERNGGARRSRGVNGDRTGSERPGGGRAGVERAPVTRNGGNPRPTSRRARRSLFAPPSRNAATGVDGGDEAEVAPVAPEAPAPHVD